MPRRFFEPGPPELARSGWHSPTIGRLPILEKRMNKSSLRIGGWGRRSIPTLSRRRSIRIPEAILRGLYGLAGPVLRSHCQHTDEIREILLHEGRIDSKRIGPEVRASPKIPRLKRRPILRGCNTYKKISLSTMDSAISEVPRDSALSIHGVGG